MVRTSKGAPPSRTALETRIRRLLPSLLPLEAAEMARITETLVETFQPRRIYIFGSRGRGSGTIHSDVDLLVIVEDTGQFPHHLAQEAYRVVGRHSLPLDIMFMSQEEFNWRAGVVTSLPATVLREGCLLYDAAA